MRLNHIQLIDQRGSVPFHHTVFVSFFQCNKPKMSIKFILSGFKAHRERQNILWCQQNIVLNNFVRRQRWCVLWKWQLRRGGLGGGEARPYLKGNDMYYRRDRKDGASRQGHTTFSVQNRKKNEADHGGRVLSIDFFFFFRSNTCEETDPMDLLGH